MSLVSFVQIEEEHPFKCLVPEGLAVHVGDQCIVEMGNVLEIGRITDLEEREGFGHDGADVPRVVRCATLQDQAKADETALLSRMARDTCEEMAKKHELEMRLIQVKYSFDRKQLTVVFSAEDRLDYRALVRELAEELHTRIEMKHIGVRDEAGIIGGMGPCGRELCCASWLKKFESINVRMAKAQRLSLNPVAISGMCGRLKCCLRYEFDQYMEADRGMPRDGDVVEGPEGEGVVCGKDILAGKVKVRLEDSRVFEYDAGKVKGISKTTREKS